jgi:hypothetical protein
MIQDTGAEVGVGVADQDAGGGCGEAGLVGGDVVDGVGYARSRLLGKPLVPFGTSCRVAPRAA